MNRPIKRFFILGDELFALDDRGRLGSWNSQALGWDMSFPRLAQQIDFMPGSRTVVVLDTDGMIWLRTRTLNTPEENPPWEILSLMPDGAGVEVDLGTAIPRV